MALITPKNIATSKLTDGSNFLTAMPSGSVLNVMQAAYTGTTTVSTAQANSSIEIFSQTVTPKAAGSQFLIQLEVKASHTNDNSMYFTCSIDGDRTLFARDSSYPAATNSWYFPVMSPPHLYDASHQIYVGNYLYQRSSGSGLASFSVAVECRHQGGTAYLNKAYSYDDAARGRPRSTLTITEVKA
jgi:hypothetical protein